MIIKIGTRATKLALAQTELFIKKLAYNGVQCEIVKCSTKGDEIKDRPLYDIGGKGLFVKDIEDRLLTGEIDIAIHSLKDVPGNLDNRFKIAGVMKRGAPEDVFISPENFSLDNIPTGSRIGTCSPRRAAQVMHIRPDLKVVAMRGNVDTRLSKLANKQADAMILAQAGLQRLGINIPREVLNPNYFIPAVGQGVIACEILAERNDLISLLSPAFDKETYEIITAERAFLAEFNGGCNLPLAAYVIKQGNKFHGKFMISDEFGESLVTKSETSLSGELPEEFGYRIARYFLDNPEYNFILEYLL